MGKDVPAALRSAPSVMLTRPAVTIPAPNALSGGCWYEPKWDGVRGTVVRDRDRTTIWSRQGTNLTAQFPEIVEASARQIKSGTVLDGELVIWNRDRTDFTALLKRLGSGPRRIDTLVAQQPASYAAFDVLAYRGEDTRGWALWRRRGLLEDIAAKWHPPLNLSPVTDDRDEAVQWFNQLTVAGIEGLVVKGKDQTYRPGRRDWIKVKHRDTIEVVAAAVVGQMRTPNLVVAGLPIDGELRIVGSTVPLTALTARAFGALLQPPLGPHPWPREVTSATVKGFGSNREPVPLTRIEPVVVEVSADVAWSGRTFRHPLRFVRARPDIPVEAVRLPSHLQRDV